MSNMGDRNVTRQDITDNWAAQDSVFAEYVKRLKSGEPMDATTKKHGEFCDRLIDATLARVYRDKESP